MQRQIYRSYHTKKIFVVFLTLLVITLYVGYGKLLICKRHQNGGAPFLTEKNPNLVNWPNGTDRFKVVHLPFATDEKVNDLGFAGLMPIRISNYSDDVDSDGAPLMIWLQGGPGSSSMIGLFNEVGPFYITKNLKLIKNPYSLRSKFSLLFIDSPLGTGFSENEAFRCDDESGFQYIHHIPCFCNPHLFPDYLNEVFCPLYTNNGYARNQAAVSYDLYSFLLSFYDLFPNTKNSKLYLAGESYAGKYIPSFAYLIQKLNKHEDWKLKIKLAGISIGDGLVDPYSQIEGHPSHALALGLVSNLQAENLNSEVQSARKHILKKKYLDAFVNREKLFELLSRYSGSINYYDVRKGNEPNTWESMENFLKLPEIREALHVTGNVNISITAVNKTSPVFISLKEDIMKSTKLLLSEVLDSGIKVLLYQGQYDFRDSIISSNFYINNLRWSGQKKYLKSPRIIWYSPECIGANVAGYITQFKNFYRFELRNAGHLVPLDQPCLSVNMFQHVFFEDT